MELKNTEKLRKACEAASQAIAKLNDETFTELKSKLDYCIGSYEHDKNPEGLVEFGKTAAKKLKAYKAKNPKKLTKKVIDDLEKFTK